MNEDSEIKNEENSTNKSNQQFDHLAIPQNVGIPIPSQRSITSKDRINTPNQTNTVPEPGIISPQTNIYTIRKESSRNKKKRSSRYNFILVKEYKRIQQILKNSHKILEKIENCGFVFYLQPIESIYSSTVLHLNN